MGARFHRDIQYAMIRLPYAHTTRLFMLVLITIGFQASAQEKSHLQLWSQFRLAGRALNQLAAQQADTNGGTEATEMALTMAWTTVRSS